MDDDSQSPSHVSELTNSRKVSSAVTKLLSELPLKRVCYR